MRLDRFLVLRKFGSRKEVEKIIKNGEVLRNGQMMKDPSQHIDQLNDDILVDGVLAPKKEFVVLMMNKPQGVISATKDQHHKTVLDLIEEPYNRYDLSIAGRLDIDTEGLVLLTNNGTYIHQLISPKKNVFKKYYVEVEEPFFNMHLLKSKYQIMDGKGELYEPLLPILEPIDETRFYLSIQEGKFHQVKRMVEHFNNRVTYLKRIAIGDIVLDEALQPGQYKEL